MYPHGVPSGGDWALDRIGSLFLQGTEDVLIDNCTFERLDGNQDVLLLDQILKQSYVRPEYPDVLQA